MRKSLEFYIENEQLFSSALLNWAAQFQDVSFLNSNRNEGVALRPMQYPHYNLLCAVDAVSHLQVNVGKAFEQLKNYYSKTGDWLFGYLSYDLKNELEQLHSKNSTEHEFSDLHFFQPRFVFILEGKKLKIDYLQGLDSETRIHQIFQEILQHKATAAESKTINSSIHSRVSKSDYLSMVRKIKEHIQLGDIYEMNYCVEFFSDEVSKNPVQLYLELNDLGHTPFSGFYKHGHNYLLCASPERFLLKQGTVLVSQPIKGTRKRGLSMEEDTQLMQELLKDDKERSENVMIVDLVRNDLSRSAVKGSVQVDELFGIYTFKQVHQMISSISSQLKESVHPVDAIKYAFPMGSMTGAPKVRAMQLIEEMEASKRGIYSGALGYFEPNGDFDFNVVIRSLIYNTKKGHISFPVGSAITANSDEEKEFDECLLKASGMFQVLGGAIQLQ